MDRTRGQGQALPLRDYSQLMLRTDCGGLLESVARRSRGTKGAVGLEVLGCAACGQVSAFAEKERSKLQVLIFVHAGGHSASSPQSRGLSVPRLLRGSSA